VLGKADLTISKSSFCLQADRLLALGLFDGFTCWLLQGLQAVRLLGDTALTASLGGRIFGFCGLDNQS